MKDWTRIYSTPDSYLAQIIKGNIEEHGIECVLINKQGSPYNILGDVEVYVHKENVLKAIKILKEHNQ
ncbi:MAG: DUF2007 domain-containing protein [Chitinophagales bacterium]|nr:DUF2007 domain-containing protein [Chitinophagales bacterium]